MNPDFDDQPVVYIGTGNTDGKLSQFEWSELCEELSAILDVFVYRYRTGGARLIGAWYSLPSTQYLSAVYGVLLPRDDQAAEDGLRAELTALAAGYQQDAIAWARAPYTLFLRPPSPAPEPASAAAAA